MHISEGVLSTPVLIAGVAGAASGIAIGLRKMKNEDIPKVGLLASAFFAASLVHIPVGPVHMHLVLNGLLGIVLGWRVFPALFVALSLQAVLFGFGGLTTLGINTCIMGIPAVGIHYLYRHLHGGFSRTWNHTLTFLSGFFAIGFATALLVLALLTTGDSFLAVAKFAFVAHLPVMLTEGLVTFFCIGFLVKVKPELLAESSIHARP